MKGVLRDYGMVLVLLVLCVFFSLATLNEQPPEGPGAATRVVEMVTETTSASDVIVVVSSAEGPSIATGALIAQGLRDASHGDVVEVSGEPRDARGVLDGLLAEGKTPAAITVTGKATTWRLWGVLGERLPALANTPVLSPPLSRQSTFLKPSNLLAIVDRIVVIAIIAIGMTMVIITAGIDLSVGSLIALSAVVGTVVMKKLGGLEAPPSAVAVGFVAVTLACGLSGVFTGIIVAWFRVAPFIVTLAIMMIAKGMAFQITGGFSIYQVPKGLTWLGQGYSFGVPNTVILLVVLYVLAHIFMSRTKMGRYIYAVGGNEEASRLSGVPVRGITILVYGVCGLLAGIGGCIQASQLNTGTPNSGFMYELYVIAAVVVGGTSLAGGSGKILGTLIGAFIISVIQNGMNLMGLESYTQQVVLGAIILAAVLLDKLRGSTPFASLKAR
jgi:ribose transport system permease protein